MKGDRKLTIPTSFHSTRFCSIHGCRITSGEDERYERSQKRANLKRLPKSYDSLTQSCDQIIQLVTLVTIYEYIISAAGYSLVYHPKN